MRRFYKLILVTLCGVFLVALSPEEHTDQNRTRPLRKLYSRPVSEWPKPNIDAAIQYEELGALPADSSWLLLDRDPQVKLGQMLFFDPRLSGSNQVSCSSCHDPDASWGDARRVSLGSDQLEGTRNAPSLLNISSQKLFFWDGRSKSLQDQAIGPINKRHEMNMEMPLLPIKLSKIDGYKVHFKEAYGDDRITIDRILDAIASFETIIKSKQSRFDNFVNGDYNALTDQEIKGLHLFRGKARCMNCHFGTYFKDDNFHNTGLTYYGRPYQDLGRYDVTRKPEDVGKFRTPSLRDVMKTSPWMHNGLFNNMSEIVSIYNSGVQTFDDKAKNQNDPLYPSRDKILKPLHLTEEEKNDLVAFLNAITTTSYKMPKPELPR